MVIGLCMLELYLPMSDSLKAKRSVLKSLLERSKNRFNISAAEVGQNDLWKNATIGIVAISNENAHLDRQLDRVVNFIENFNGVELIKYSIEHL